MLQYLNHLHRLDPLLQCGLASAEERGRITSLDLLATLCLMQPGMQPKSLRVAAFLYASSTVCSETELWCETSGSPLHLQTQDLFP